MNYFYSNWTTNRKHGSKMANYSNRWNNVPGWEFSNWIWFSRWGKTTNKKSSMYMPQLLWWWKTVFKLLLLLFLKTKFYLYFFVFTIVILFIEMVLVRGYIFVMCQAVIKCMEKHLIYVLILDGTQVNGLLFVTGNTVVNDLLDQMNFRYKIILLINKYINI